MSNSAPNLHSAALRVSVLHILRAAGFHSTRPSVLDALVNITERYLLLLASSTAAHALTNHNSTTPTVSDVRAALTEAGALTSISGGGGSAEEHWTEALRPSEADYEGMAHGQLRREQDVRRFGELDTADVKAFAEWLAGDKSKEVRRVAGEEVGGGTRVAGGGGHEDFLTQLRRRNKPAVDEERWAGTVLGREGEDRELVIEGGEVTSVSEWAAKLREKNSKTTKRTETNGEKDVDMTGVLR